MSLDATFYHAVHTMGGHVLMFDPLRYRIQGAWGGEDYQFRLEDKDAHIISWFQRNCPERCGWEQVIVPKRVLSDLRNKLQHIDENTLVEFPIPTDWTHKYAENPQDRMIQQIQHLKEFHDRLNKLTPNWAHNTEDIENERFYVLDINY